MSALGQPLLELKVPIGSTGCDRLDIGDDVDLALGFDQDYHPTDKWHSAPFADRAGSEGSRCGCRVYRIQEAARLVMPLWGIIASLDRVDRISMQDGETDIHAKRVLAIREEMKFEIGILHDRVNALVSAEAFLIISFTMSLAYSNDRWSGRFFWVAPLLATIGFLLAILAWFGVKKGVEIVTEWNELLIQALHEASNNPRFVWRPSVDIAGDVRTQDHHRRSMLFARFAPAVFAVAWVLLAAIVLIGPMWQP